LFKRAILYHFKLQVCFTLSSILLHFVGCFSAYISTHSLQYILQILINPNIAEDIFLSSYLIKAKDHVTSCSQYKVYLLLKFQKHFVFCHSLAV